MERFEKCFVDNENKINGWPVGMSEEEIKEYCDKYKCRLAYYDTENRTIKG